MSTAALLDAVKEHLAVKTDADLAKQLRYSRQSIYNFRNTGEITSALEIAILEATNWGLWEMRGKGRG